MDPVIIKQRRNIRVISEGLRTYYGAIGLDIESRIASAIGLTEIQRFELEVLVDQEKRLTRGEGGDARRYVELAKKLAITVGHDRLPARLHWVTCALVYVALITLVGFYNGNFSSYSTHLLAGLIPFSILGLVKELSSWFKEPPKVEENSSFYFATNNTFSNKGRRASDIKQTSTAVG